MSNPDSFIEEVTEEVRRDQLFKLMRRYGWIAALLIVVVVAGAAWNEWRKAQAAAEAQARGDALLAALDQGDRDARRQALEAISTEGPSQRVVDLLVAGEALAADDPVGAAARLRLVADDQTLSRAYRDLAMLKLVLLPEGGPSAEERRSILAGLAAPGAPYRLLAEEQLAVLDLSEGQRDAAIDRLKAIIEDNEVTAGLRERATQLIVVSGGSLDGS